MAISNLEEKFIHDLGDIYDAEHRFLEAQQEMLSQATDRQLRTMLQEHIGQTQQQISNLEQVYQILGQRTQRVKCDAAAGLVIEGQKSMREAAQAPAILDCVISGAAAKVEHYEIASYRGLVTACEEMGQNPILQLLEQNLQQEHETAHKIEQSMPMLIRQAMQAKQRGI